MSLMRALSLWQPWASLVAIGAKGWETRGWAIPADGQPLVIHAAQKNDSVVSAAMVRPQFAHALRGVPVPFGAAICIVKPVETLTTVEALRQGKISEVEYVFGDYREFDDNGKRRYATRLEIIRVLQKPIFCTGRQKFFRVEVPE